MAYNSGRERVFWVCFCLLIESIRQSEEGKRQRQREDERVGEWQKREKEEKGNITYFIQLHATN